MASRFTQPLITIGRLLDRAVQDASNVQQRVHQQGTHYRSGALKPKPEQTPFGLVAVLCAVVPGLFIGAAISKSVANFLEENDLFVPSDDDDDDD